MSKIEYFLKRKNQAGLTLIEMAMVLGLTAIIIGPLTTIYLSSMAGHIQMDLEQTVDSNNKAILIMLKNQVFCTTNLKNPTAGSAPLNYDINSSTFNQQGIAVTINNVVNGQKNANSIIIGDGTNFGGLAVNSVRLQHVRQIDTNHNLAKLITEYRDPAGKSKFKAAINLILDMDLTDSKQISSCQSDETKWNITSNMGQKICGLIMQSVSGNSGWKYDPNLKACVRLPISDFEKVFTGPTTNSESEAFCEMPYINQSPTWGSCNANVVSDCCTTNSCGRGYKCGFKRPLPGGNEIITPSPTSNCRAITGAGGAPGCHCDFPDGVMAQAQIRCVSVQL